MPGTIAILISMCPYTRVMVYVERLKRGVKTYYYITRNIRHGDNKWKKSRHYFGTEEPTASDLKKFQKDYLKEREKWMLGEDIPDIDLFFSTMYAQNFVLDSKSFLSNLL